MTAPLEPRLAAIEERNVRVETDKAWETSWTRRVVIAVITYVAVGFMLMLINADNPWLGAIIPVLGFLLSTLSLPLVKNVWATWKCSCLSK
jgi:purine-cytosine permease-like protein